MNFLLLISNTPKTTNATELNIELTLSIVALIISLGSAGFEYFWNQRINKTNLEADLFKDIYEDYLIKRIPEARNKIRYNNNKILDTEELIDVLNDIRRSSLFYKYKDKKYYRLLCDTVQNLEDILVKKTGQELQSDDYADFVSEINTAIEKIYDILMKKYIGQKIRF